MTSLIREAYRLKGAWLRVSERERSLRPSSRRGSPAPIGSPVRGPVNQTPWETWP